jgi:hypothetical protein
VIAGDLCGSATATEGCGATGWANIYTLIDIPEGPIYYKLEWSCNFRFVHFYSDYGPIIVNQPVPGATVVDSCEGAEGYIPAGRYWFRVGVGGNPDDGDQCGDYLLVLGE